MIGCSTAFLGEKRLIFITIIYRRPRCTTVQGRKVLAECIPSPRYYLSPCTPKSGCSEAVENPVFGIYLAKVPFVDRASRVVEPIDEWSSAELKAELKDLDLSTSGNKQELYDRLVEYEDDWVEDSESGISDIFGRVANIVVGTVLLWAQLLECWYLFLRLYWPGLW